MKKKIRLTESDLIKVIERTLLEQEEGEEKAPSTSHPNANLNPMTYTSI